MEILQQALPVFAVLAVLVASLWFLRRGGMVQFRGLPRSSRKERQLEVIERLQLTPQHAVCLVRLNKRTMLIGTAPSGCSLLHKDEETC